VSTKEWMYCKKNTWGDGPWQNEIDKREWVDPATGYTCIIRRNSHSGTLCGYVGVPPTHVLYGAKLDELGGMQCHGGVTYTEPCEEGTSPTVICHVPAPGEPDTLWWIGFDCAHGLDYAPALVALVPALLRITNKQEYRDWPYVERNVLRLAAQLKEQETHEQPTKVRRKVGRHN
jgi:hypothetical protein